MGCTTGAKILDYGRRLFVFKNKDFEVNSYSDGLALEQSHAFGIRGMNLETQQSEGFSIGANQSGLVVVNSNVLTTNDPPYDLVTEKIVLEANTVDEAIAICEQEISESSKWQSCNMIVASLNQLAAIELTATDLAITQTNDYVIRTNHHQKLNTNEKIMTSNPKNGINEIKNSKSRLNQAENYLKEITEAEEVVTLLRTHHEEASICRHGKLISPDLALTTVYSYIVRVYMEHKPRIFFDVVKGPPCMQAYTSFELKFPSTEYSCKSILTKYPF